MTTASIITALWPGLARILRALGRWILPKIKRLGLAIVGYMHGKVDDFKRRRLSAKAEWRKRWLSGRIRRWLAASKWLSQAINGYGLRSQFVCEYRRAFDKLSTGIPLVSPQEREPRRAAA